MRLIVNFCLNSLFADAAFTQGIGIRAKLSKRNDYTEKITSISHRDLNDFCFANASKRRRSISAN